MARIETHPGERALRALAAGRGSARTRRHVEGCSACRKELALVKTLAAALPSAAADACPDAQQLVELAHGLLSAQERAALDAHLTACLDCSVELESLSRADAAVERLPGVVAAAGSGLLERLKGLVRFELPVSLALTTRSGAVAAPGFAAAMERYREGELAAARAGLEQAQAAGERLPELDFYLGVCLLAEGQAEAAAAALRRAVKARARLSEYRWYLAQALLQAGHAAQARSELERVARAAGARREAARELLAELRKLV